METRFVIATLGIIWLGLLALRTAVASRIACHYTREMLAGLGFYLLCAGLLRLGAPVAGIDGNLTREFTGWLAWMAAAGLTWTAVAHWLFHRLLNSTLEDT